MTFHTTNYGRFADGIPTDIDGYAHTTAREWMAAPMDWGTNAPRSCRLTVCAEKARETREQLKSADAALAEWRERKPRY